MALGTAIAQMGTAKQFSWSGFSIERGAVEPTMGAKFPPNRFAPIRSSGPKATCPVAGWNVT